MDSNFPLKHYWQFTLKPRLLTPYYVLKFLWWGEWKQKQDMEYWRKNGFASMFMADGSYPRDPKPQHLKGATPSFKEFWIENQEPSRKVFIRSQAMMLYGLLKEERKLKTKSKKKKV